LKILFVTNTMAVGGVETNLVGLSRALRSLGHDVTVVSCGGPLAEELTRHIQYPLNLRNPRGLITSAIALRRFIRREGIEMAHAMSAAANVALLLASRDRHCAFVSSPMGLQNSDREARWVTHLRNRLLVLRTDRVLVISDEIERALKRAGVASHRLVRCAVVGVDEQALRRNESEATQVRGELGVGPDERVVTTIGALHPRKSHDLFLAAAAIVVRRAVHSVRFLIVGDGPQRTHLHKAVSDFGLARHVEFLGQRRDIRAILSATDVYVKPGIVEGFVGITVLEAMAIGVPVVAFDTRDVRAAVTPGETGLIVPTRDVAALAESVQGILDDPVSASKLVSQARRRVEERFSLQAVARGLVDAYAAIRDDRPRSTFH
jgi:glycosyltransferase involved in cell wall biosynthesis